MKEERERAEPRLEEGEEEGGGEEREEEREEREEGEGGRGGRARGGLGRQMAPGQAPRTHTGEEEQDSREECDDLTSQPQVVHRGAVRVGRLKRWGCAAGPYLLSTSGPIQMLPTAPNIWALTASSPHRLPPGISSRLRATSAPGHLPPHPTPPSALLPICS